MKQGRIYLANSYEIRVLLETWAEPEKAYVPFEGDGAIAWLSALPDGPPIHDDVNLLLTATNEPGVYVATVSRDIVDAQLTPFLGQPIYQIVQAGPSDELTTVTTLLVTGPLFIPTP